MDFTSAVRTDTLPAVASVLVPGATAISPYVAQLLLREPTVRVFATEHEASSLVASLLLIVGAGFIVESVGSYIEYYVIDRQHVDRDAMIKSWRRYLQLTWAVEPVGQRYLRRLLAVFKYELNMLTAAVFALPGVVWLGFAGLLSAGTVWALALLTVGAGVYLFQAATATSRLLAELRDLLLDAAAAASPKRGSPGLQPTAAGDNMSRRG